MRKLENYTPTEYMAEGSRYDKASADYVVAFIERLKHTKGEFYNGIYGIFASLLVFCYIIYRIFERNIFN